MTFSERKKFREFQVFRKKNVLRFLSFRYSADFRRSRLVFFQLAGSKCLTDSCDGKFETVTIFESNGRVKKRMVADHKGKAEQKAKKEKSKKKKNEMEKSDNNDGQTAKQGSSNSMSFAETSTRSEDDAEKRKDPQGKIKMDGNCCFLLL